MSLFIAKQNDEFLEGFYILTLSVGVSTSERSTRRTRLRDEFSDIQKLASHLVNWQLDGVQLA